MQVDDQRILLLRRVLRGKIDVEVSLFPKRRREDAPVCAVIAGKIENLAVQPPTYVRKLIRGMDPSLQRSSGNGRSQAESQNDQHSRTNHSHLRSHPVVRHWLPSFSFDRADSVRPVGANGPNVGRRVRVGSFPRKPILRIGRVWTVNDESVKVTSSHSPGYAVESC